MIIDGNIRFGDGIDNPASVLSMLRRGLPVYNAYLVCVSPVSGNLLEILHSIHMNKSGVVGPSHRILAVAQGKAEAFDFVRLLTEEWIRENMDENKNVSFANFISSLSTTLI